MKNLIWILIVFTLLGVGGWFAYDYWFSHNTSPEVLYERYFKPNPNYWTKGVAETDTNALKFTAMRCYEQNNHQLAIDAFHKFEPEPVDEGFYNFYLAICYLKTDFTNLAINHLIIAAESFTDFTHIYMARWYLALAYLKNDRVNDCRNELNQIIKMNSSYKGLAQQLKKELEGQ